MENGLHFRDTTYFYAITLKFLEVMSKVATVAFGLCRCKCWQYKVYKQKNLTSKFGNKNLCAWNCQWKLPFINHNHFKRAGVLCETIISCFVHSSWSTCEISYSSIIVVKDLYSMDVGLPSPKLMAQSKDEGFFLNFF